jgi:hypothetical protein
VCKIRVIVALYQLRGRVGAKMLEIDTIQKKVRIAQKSIFCEVFTHPGRRPAFFMPENRGGWPGEMKAGGGEMNTAVTIAFYRYCRIGNPNTWYKDNVSNSFM